MVGTGRMGSAMARSLARGGSRPILHNRTPERARGAGRRSCARSRRPPAAAAAAADVVITMLATTRRCASLSPGRRPPGRRRAGRSRCRHEHGPAVVTVRRSAASRSAAGSGILDAPVSGSVTRAETGELTIMAGDCGGPRARPSGARAAGDEHHHIGRLGRQPAAEARGQHADLRAQPSPCPRRSSSRSGPASIARIAYDVFAAGAAGAPYVAVQADGVRGPRPTRRPSRSTSPRRTCA